MSSLVPPESCDRDWLTCHAHIHAMSFRDKQLYESVWNVAHQSLNTLYIPYKKTYGHQTLHDGDLQLGFLTYEVIWHFKKSVFIYHMIS